MDLLPGNFSKPRHLPHYEESLRLQFVTYRIQLPNVDLSQPHFASIIIESWQHFNGCSYDLISWVVMPDHVHVLIRPFEHEKLSKIVGSRKSFSAMQINRILGRSGRLWQKDYWDRAVRNSNHMGKILSYMRNNPFNAGLISKGEDYQWWGLDLSSLGIFD